MFYPSSVVISYGFFLPAEAGMRTCGVGFGNEVLGEEEGDQAPTEQPPYYLGRFLESSDTSRIAQGALSLMGSVLGGLYSPTTAGPTTLQKGEGVLAGDAPQSLTGLGASSVTEKSDQTIRKPGEPGTGAL